MPCVSCPVSAEGGIEDQNVILHKLVRIAILRRPVPRRCPPLFRLGCFGNDVRWNRFAGEKVDRDARRVPFHRIYSTSIVVERLAVVVRLGTELAASLVPCLVGCAVARCGQCRARAVVLWDRTSRLGMQRSLVPLVPVYALDDINLTTLWPIGAIRPKSGPSSTPVWHVDRVDNDETAVDDNVRVHANRLAIPRDFGGRFDAHDRVPFRVDFMEASCFGSFKGLVVDRTVCRIGERPELPGVEKVVAFHGGLEIP